MTMEMEIWMEMALEMAMEMEMWMKMVMEMVMVIFGARKARSELRFASKWLLTSYFEILEASGAPKGDQEKLKKFPNASKKLPRSPQEASERFLGGALGALGGPKSSPSHDPPYIHRFQSLQEPPRESPSHDLSALSTFQSVQEGDAGVIRTRGLDVVRARADPRTRSRTRFIQSLFIGRHTLNADVPLSLIHI